MKNEAPILCCIPIEWIQPWDQNEAIRQVKALKLGNMVQLQGTFHVGNSEEERRKWKELFPHLTEKVDATPRFPERPKHGMAVLFDLPIEFRLEQLRLCRALGLKVLGFFPARLNLPPDEFVRLTEAGEGVVLTEMIMCENLSILGGTLALERLKRIDAAPVVSHSQRDSLTPAREGDRPSIFDNPGALNFQVVHDWFVGRFRKVGENLRGRGIARLGAIEASVQMRLAMEAGVDVPVLELVPHDPLRGLAAVRGAAKAYGQAQWGVHAAMGYYRAPTDMWTPERLRIAYNLFFAGGASIFTECNMPLRNWGSCSAFFSIPATPPIRQGEEECREWNDPICVRSRELLAEHYRFTQFHRRPPGGPRVRLGFVLGNLDGWGGGGGERMWMVDHPGFLAASALQTWRHFDRLFDSETWYVPPRKNYWQADPSKPLRHGTPPCGQVDLVPLETPEKVLAEYGSLAFLGWNTMTEDYFAKLLAFVQNGGQLFIGTPHFSTRVRTDNPQTFFRDGDIRELCGVRILGPGDAMEEVLFAEQSENKRCAFPQGTLYLEAAPLARLELHGARILAHPRGRPDQPVLLEHRVGKGCVYLLATWDYPGSRMDAFITDILRTLAESEQGEIAVEGRDVFYAIHDGCLPSGAPFSLAYLVNHDLYGQPAYPRLRVRGASIPVRAAQELRLAWILEDLVIAPHDRFVKVVDARKEADAWRVTIEATRPDAGVREDAERAIQIEATAGRVGRVELDGHPLALEQRSEGDAAVRCRLTQRHTLTVNIRPLHGDQTRATSSHRHWTVLSSKPPAPSSPSIIPNQASRTSALGKPRVKTPSR